jgi:hypothetical protein
MVQYARQDLRLQAIRGRRNKRKEAGDLIASLFLLQSFLKQ